MDARHLTFTDDGSWFVYRWTNFVKAKLQHCNTQQHNINRGFSDEETNLDKPI